MNALRNLYARLVSAVELFQAAVSASASVRAHRVPAARDLRRLGIDADSVSVAAMANY